MSHRRSCIAIALMMFALAAGRSGAENAGTIQPFNGKDLAGWKTRAQGQAQSKWVVGKAALNTENPKRFQVEAAGAELINDTEWGGLDLHTEAAFGDCLIEVEVMVPKGSNSGIYLMGEYELQVLDSFGKEKIGMGDMGSIYSASVAAVNAAKPAGEWQKYVIDFRAPRFDAAGNKTANGLFVKVTLNGQVIHENVEVVKSTGGGLTGKEHPTGPLMFQGNHGAVAFRNIRITPK